IAKAGGSGQSGSRIDRTWVIPAAECSSSSGMPQIVTRKRVRFSVILPFSPEEKRGRGATRDSRFHPKTWAIIESDQGRSALLGVIQAKQWSSPDGEPISAT